MSISKTSHFKYLSVRSGKLRVFSTITKSESVPNVKDIFRLRYLSWSFLEENKSFMTVGPVSSAKVLVPNVEYVPGHFFTWICFKN